MSLSIMQGLYHLQNAVHEACVSKVVQPSQTRYKAIIAGDMSEFTLQVLVSIQPLAWRLAMLTCVQHLTLLHGQWCCSDFTSAV